ncbi:GNAT family N-acetyltransferase [Roseobacter sp.]|uniref:GNAT family N-acetyltransferase n=1 Tax=Roseobacter sp. TaxID=1907202 RepID=UPI0032975634
MFDAAPVPALVPLQQSDSFIRALDAIGTPHLRLADGTVVLRRKWGPVPVSMIARPAAQTPHEMHELARSVPGKGLQILAPDRPMALNQIGALPLVSPNWVATLDLTPDTDSLMAAQHQKWRNRLRHAQGQNLRITRQNLPDDPDHWLLQADQSQQRAQGYRAWPAALTQAYARANRSHAKLFTAFYGREPVAGIVILRHGLSTSYHIGHTRPSGRVMSAHNLLIWSAILWAKSKDLQTLELGTLDSEDASGLARFKLGTGAVARPLGGTWLRWLPLTSPLRHIARIDRKLMHLG